VGAAITVDANDLLAVSPKLLAQAILHRRERLADIIPEDLDQRRVELMDAEPKAKSAREERNLLNNKVANLKKERDDAQKKARALFEESNDIRAKLIEEGGFKNPDPKWAKEKLSERLKQIENQLETSAGNHKTEEKFINEMKSLIREHEDWVLDRESSQPLFKKMKKARDDARKLLDSAQKAHLAMVELVEENSTLHENFIEWEETRKRARSRTKRLENALLSSQDALEFWKERIQTNDFADLLSDAERVRLGGKSSKAKAREEKQARESTKMEEEE
tara:strand:+ start:640 stop:1473 length:834 start_codon:yes stop_codon:yes gene_type:complete